MYTVVFLTLAIFSGVCSGAAVDHEIWLSVVSGWTAIAFLGLATAYAGAGPRVFGKCDSGRQALLCRLLLAPYFALNAIVWRLHRLVSRESAFAAVVPNLFFGRRLTNAEARAAAAQSRWHAILDLAPEFAEAPNLRTLPGYRSLSVLDATAPTSDQLRSATDWLAATVATGPTYVHCALGHGRTGCVVVAYLLATGTVSTIADGVRLLRARRPGVRLNRSQRAALAALVTSPGAGSPT